MKKTKTNKEQKNQKYKLTLKKSVYAFWKLYTKGEHKDLTKEEYDVLKIYS